MADIKLFIEQARTKGLEDNQIKQALISQGWNEGHVSAALAGLEIPSAPPSSKTPDLAHQAGKRPSLSPLLAALQHILLWFFTSSSTVTIAGVITTLSGADVSSTSLASMIAITIVTFTSYAILFIIFLLKARKTPGLIPGKVWSIITICLHTVGAMIATITAIVTAITDGESSVLISAILIASLNVIVLVTYCFAAFASLRLERLRQIVIRLYLPILLIFFGVLSVMSLLQLGPAKHDEQLRKDLAVTVQGIRGYAQDNKKLPDTLGALSQNPAIEYKKKTASSYEVCADFQTKKKSLGRGLVDSPASARDDSYVDEYLFFTYAGGRQCFTFKSAPLQEQNGTAPVSPIYY